jgi:hypothetical protein
MRWTLLFVLGSCLGLPACGGKDDAGGGGETGTGASTGIVTDPGATSTTPSTVDAGDASATSADATADDTSTADSTAGPGPVAPTECTDGVIYQCGDGIDNDDDGLVDLADPECVGPCDDDEGSFQTGLPGDNVDCLQDCFFDGNSGHEDNCWWNVVCDAANPGEGGLCEYMDSPMCNMQPPVDTSLCEDNCLPSVPNGCDCYGCCTVVVDGEEINIWLGSGPDCALDNLDACASCTLNTECGNPCEPEACEVCFGGTLPEGCDDPGCDNDMPCTVDANGDHDCPEGFFCLSGCCTDYVPEG